MKIELFGRCNMTISEMRAKKEAIEKVERVKKNAEILYVSNSTLYADGYAFEELMEYLYSKEEAGIISEEDVDKIALAITNKYAMTTCGEMVEMSKKILAVVW